MENIQDCIRERAKVCIYCWNKIINKFICANLVLSIEKETPHSANSYPLSATIFIVTFGLVLGAYLNKLLSGSSY